MMMMMMMTMTTTTTMMINIIENPVFAVDVVCWNILQFHAQTKTSNPFRSYVYVVVYSVQCSTFWFYSKCIAMPCFRRF